MQKVLNYALNNFKEDITIQKAAKIVNFLLLLFAVISSQERINPF